MSFWKDFFDILSKVITSLGIIIGGIWTYRLFIKQRLGLPKVEINLGIDEVKLHNELKLIHAHLKLVNTGTVMLTSDRAELRLKQVYPIPDGLKPSFKKGFDPVLRGNTEIEWPMLAGRQWEWEKGEFEIEPGESDSLNADFVINADVEVAEFYFFIANANKKKQGIGWSLTRINHFQNKDEFDMAKNQENEKGYKSNQQKPQKSQKPKQQQVPNTNKDKSKNKK